MRIHRLELVNYRGIARSEVHFAERGVTIVEGPNEVGKTSLAEAIDLVLGVRDSSTGQRVRAVQPVHADVGTEVTIEVSTGPYRFVLTKQWNKGRRTELEVVAPAHEHLRGREAHDRVEAILAETLDPSLWSALRLAQGAAPGPVAFGEVLSLGRVLDASAGDDHSTDRESDLWERVCDERDRYWTATGLPRVERVALAKRVEGAAARVAEATDQLRQLADAADEVARLGDELTQLDATRRDLEQRGGQLAAQVAEVAAKRSELRLLDAEAVAARSRCDVAAAARSQRDALLDAVARRRAELADAQRTLTGREPELALRRARHEALRTDLEVARRRLAAAEHVHDLAVGDRDHRRREIEVGQLAERRDRVQAAERRLEAAEAALGGVVVDDEMVARIEAAELEVARVQAAARAAGAVVRVAASQRVSVEVDDAVVVVDPGDSVELVVGQSFSIDVPGVVAVELEPGLDARALGDQVRVATDELAKLCAEAGVDGRDAARSAADRRRHALDDRRAAEVAIAADLRDLTLEVIASKVRGLSRRIAEYLETRPATPPLAVDFDAAKVAAEAAERELAVARDLAAQAEQRVAGTDQELIEVEKDLAGLTARVEQAASAVEVAVATLEAARAEVADAELVDAVDGASRTLDDALGARAAAERDLAAADPDALEARVANAEAAAARAADRWAEVGERRRELQMLLDVKGELGLAEQLDDAATELEHLERERRRTEARAEAARALHSAFSEARTQARLRYVAPFRTRIEQLGRIVFGPTFEVALDEDLAVATRTLDGVTLPLDHLSAGAREQLGVIARLACAGIVSADGGAPVIFDDTLGWSDPDRLDTMGATIALAGRDCQVIVLTCTPDRYASVGTATVVRLARGPAPAAPQAVLEASPPVPDAS